MHGFACHACIGAVLKFSVVPILVHVPPKQAHLLLSHCHILFNLPALGHKTDSICYLWSQTAMLRLNKREMDLVKLGVKSLVDFSRRTHTLQPADKMHMILLSVSWY